METVWFYDENEIEKGPFSREAIRNLMQDGLIRRETLVWRAGRVGVKSAAAVGGPVNLPEQHVVGVDLKQMALAQIGDFVIESKPEIASVATRPSRQLRPADEAEEITFFVKSGPNSIGPLRSEVLANMADAGKIALTDLIKRSNESAWLPASEVPEVIAAGLLSSGNVPPSPRAETTFAFELQQAASNAPKTAGERDREKPRKRKASAATRNRRKNRSWVEERASAIRAKREREARQGERGVAKCLDSDQESQVPDAQSTVAETTLSLGVDNRKSPHAVAPTHEHTNPAPAYQLPFEKTAIPAGGHSPVNSTNPAPYGHGAGSVSAAPGAHARQWTPPARKAKGGNFVSNLPIKHLSIGAASLAILALLYFMVPSLLNLGDGLPSQFDVEAQLQTFVDTFETAKASPTTWDSFVSEVHQTAGGFIKQYRSSPGQRTTRDIELQEAATALIQLVNSGAEKADQHQKFLTIAEAKLAGWASA